MATENFKAVARTPRHLMMRPDGYYLAVEVPVPVADLVLVLFAVLVAVAVPVGELAGLHSSLEAGDDCGD